MEFLNEVIRYANLPYTVLLGVIVLFWITVIIGALDIEVFDFDIDADVDVDVDIDVDVDVDTDIGGGNIFSFLNLGAIPFSIWVSIFVLQLWFYSLIGNVLIDNLNWHLHAFFRFVLTAVIFVPTSAIITKFITIPLKKFLTVKKALSKKDFVGKSCVVTSSKVNPNFGIAEMATSGAPVIINIRAEVSEELTKGSEALIYEYDKIKNLFYVTKIKDKMN